MGAAVEAGASAGAAGANVPEGADTAAAPEADAINCKDSKKPHKTDIDIFTKRWISKIPAPNLLIYRYTDVKKKVVLSKCFFVFFQAFKN
jgi:hypothetical protein